MDHECLRPHGLDKPAALEERSKGRHTRDVARGGKLGPACVHGGGAHDKEERGEGHDVKQRAHGAQLEHKALDGRGVPGTRAGSPGVIDGVPRQCDAHDLVDQRQQYQLQGAHGQKRQEQARDGHGQHIAKVGAHRGLEVLEQVAVSAAAFDDAALEHAQVLLKQDDIGGFLGNIDGRIDRDAAIARTHGGGVVDAVAHKAHGVAEHLAHDTYQARLLQRRELGEEVGFLGALGKFGVIERIDLGAEQDVARIDTNLLADGGGDAVVVAG